jgi:hypothetical protein
VATLTAGTVYARGPEETASYVEAGKSEYRKVSQEWHRFLEFLPSSLPSRNRLLSETTNRSEVPPKRARNGVDLVPQKVHKSCSSSVIDC